MMRTLEQHGPEFAVEEGRRPYIKPEVQRVDLALEETLSAGCKLNGTECTDPFPGIGQAGS
jgi:hypothetical protein